MWRETATSGRGRAPRSVRTSPLHPGGWPSQPAGRAPGPLQRAWGLGVDVDTRRPALTPGGRPRPGPRQGRRGGAVPRKGLQGPRTKRPHWGRRASGRRRGREITFWGPSGGSRSARSLFKGGPTPLAKGGRWSPTRRPPPSATGSTFVPLSPRLHWAGQGTRLPSARLQHKARPGEGKSHSRVHSRGSRSPRRPCRAPHAPLRGQHNFSSPEVGFLRELMFGGQLPGTFRCQLGPAPLGQRTGSRGPHLRRDLRRDPRAALAPAPRPARRPRCAQTRLRRKGWAPGLGKSALN